MVVEAAPLTPVIPAMSVERQVTMPGTVVVEDAGGAHHHHIGDVVVLTPEAGHAPGAVQGQLDQELEEAQSMIPAHDQGTGLDLEDAQSLGHHHPDETAPDLHRPEGAVPGLIHPKIMAETDHLTVLDQVFLMVKGTLKNMVENCAVVKFFPNGL